MTTELHGLRKQKTKMIKLIIIINEKWISRENKLLWECLFYSLEAHPCDRNKPLRNYLQRTWAITIITNMVQWHVHYQEFFTSQELWIIVLVTFNTVLYSVTMLQNFIFFKKTRKQNGTEIKMTRIHTHLFQFCIRNLWPGKNKFASLLYRVRIIQSEKKEKKFTWEKLDLQIITMDLHKLFYWLPGLHVYEISRHSTQPTMTLNNIVTGTHLLICMTAPGKSFSFLFFIFSLSFFLSCCKHKVGRNITSVQAFCKKGITRLKVHCIHERLVSTEMLFNLLPQQQAPLHPCVVEKYTGIQYGFCPPRSFHGTIRLRRPWTGNFF